MTAAIHFTVYGKPEPQGSTRAFLQEWEERKRSWHARWQAYLQEHPDIVVSR